ncbi:MAG: hypothetical protein U0942_02455 [Parvibaculum sp.]|uniref:hypothetical protein n=1 Tax=Parvibaculum sp. TaxID=2024848 RepID=UPI002AB9506B|nr:hypothetical protein [Parvibaculum sp.]MDZ4380183.1 hypothetical protein [Parvibaculum sp.]
MREIIRKLFNVFSAFVTYVVLGAGELSFNERVLIVLTLLQVGVGVLTYLD